MLQHLSKRNDPSVSYYGPKEASLYTSDISQVKINVTTTGERRYIYLSDKSMLVLGEETPAGTFYAKYFPPGQTLLNSGWYTENNTAILLSDGKLHRYRGLYVDNTTDSPTETLDLTSYLYGYTLNDFQVSNTVLGSRMVVFPTSGGVLVLQISENLWNIQDSIFLTEGNDLLYGGSSVQWVTTSGLESTRRGKLLVGTTAQGDSFVTLVDLASRSILKSWNAGDMLNSSTSTGEFLRTEASAYSGIPFAPVLTSLKPTPDGTSLELLWTQERSDLILSYEIQVSIDNTPFILAEKILSGAIQEFIYPNYHEASSYSLRIRSANSEGFSPWSTPVILERQAGGCLLGAPGGSGFNIGPRSSAWFDSKTFPGSPRTHISLAGFSQAPWVSETDPNRLGSKKVSFVGNSLTTKIQGQIQVERPSLISLSYLASIDNAEFTLSLGGLDISVPASNGEGWKEVLLSETTLIYPGTWPFEITYTNPPVGSLNSLDALSLIPPITLEEKFRGRSWMDCNHTSITQIGDWDIIPVYPGELSLPQEITTNFPNNVTTATGNGLLTSLSPNSKLLIPFSTSQAQALRFHFKKQSGGIVTYSWDGVNTGTFSEDGTLNHRAVADIPIPVGTHLLELQSSGLMNLDAISLPNTVSKEEAIVTTTKYLSSMIQPSGALRDGFDSNLLSSSPGSITDFTLAIASVKVDPSLRPKCKALLSWLASRIQSDGSWNWGYQLGSNGTYSPITSPDFPGTVSKGFILSQVSPIIALASYQEAWGEDEYVCSLIDIFLKGLNFLIENSLDKENGLFMEGFIFQSGAWKPTNRQLASDQAHVYTGLVCAYALSGNKKYQILATQLKEAFDVAFWCPSLNLYSHHLSGAMGQVKTQDLVTNSIEAQALPIMTMSGLAHSAEVLALMKTWISGEIITAPGGVFSTAEMALACIALKGDNASNTLEQSLLSLINRTYPNPLYGDGGVRESLLTTELPVRTTAWTLLALLRNELTFIPWSL